VNAAELAELAGVTVQRIYQYESDRKAGRGTFPAPALDGYWLRTVAEHWAKYRKTKPGPAPMTVDEAFTAAGKASKRIAQERRARE
jgi:transcriptional regulator with XRE-family HTH domain